LTLVSVLAKIIYRNSLQEIASIFACVILPIRIYRVSR